MTALLLLCIQLLVSSCGNSTNNLPDYAYIGGEILNPSIAHVIIKHNGKILDTIPLDDENKFSYKIDNVEKGLYLLQHKPETLNIYLAPGDSLLLRANTLAFDESIHFSGIGREKNNFMANMFLEDENTSQLLLNFHEYSPEVFLKISDSIKEERVANLQRTSKKRKFSEEFSCLAMDVINSENGDLKERYTYLVNKYYREYSKQFPTNFHDYREDIDFNSVALQCSPGYKRLLENYLINYSLSWCAGSGLDESNCYSLTNINNVVSRIKRAGELIHLPDLREYILEKIAVRGIVMSKSGEDINTILQELENQGLEEEDLEEMQQLGTIQLAFLPGTSLSRVELLNMAGELQKIEDVVEKPTVIFLWSIYDTGYDEEQDLIEQYRRRYPEVDFIGVNLDLAEEPAWRVNVRKNDYNPAFQFQVAPTRIGEEFFKYYQDKLMFLNPNSVVEVGDIYLNSPEFESRLVAFLNQ